jgi:hypothetical protein
MVLLLRMLPPLLCLPEETKGGGQMKAKRMAQK